MSGVWSGSDNLDPNGFGCLRSLWDPVWAFLDYVADYLSLAVGRVIGSTLR